MDGQPIRIQLSRRKGWRMPPNTVKVARPSGWGNPYRIGPAIECQGVKIPAMTRELAVQCYREHIERMLAAHQSTRDAVATLRGKNLACWCPLDQPCHADVLLEKANA